jgi:hypothetical protein
LVPVPDQGRLFMFSHLSVETFPFFHYTLRGLQYRSAVKLSWRLRLRGFGDVRAVIPEFGAI